ncbi:hypothetical protein [Pectobacterium polaris]|uniref:Uncharacterized protein n=1 Tax=Pectobacterium polaris TaxID=2042057 RepID=A0AAW5G7I7_9GAMM|nr:hypothetical protein [Pectobacterium polaris]MCL6350402.1 hypothetical protein [Pectobacterium polaris]MCL6367674.1 hypothetical protein [Pectobacterium polaris]
MTIGNLDALIDTARIVLEPLDPHYMAQKDAAFKNDYLTLLATLLLENGALNKDQQRLMTLLLTAITPSSQLAYYLQQASKLEADELRRILDNLRQDQHASQALLFDFVVVQRIARPLNVTDIERLSWLAKLTGLNEEQVLHISFWSQQLLGITIPLENFASIAKKVNITALELSYLPNAPDNATFPQKGEFLTQGRYVYVRENSFEAKPGWVNILGVLAEKYILRTVYIRQSCIVFNIIMDEVKSRDSNYGKNGEPVFDIIKLPPAFCVWQSFFYRELP